MKIKKFTRWLKLQIYCSLYCSSSLYRDGVSVSVLVREPGGGGEVTEGKGINVEEEKRGSSLKEVFLGR